MQLSLPPELEAQLRQRSEQVGLTPDQYLTTLLSRVLSISPASPLSPHASTITLLQSWNEAAKKLSPEESARAELEFEELKRNMNETRKLEGRPPAFY